MNKVKVEDLKVNNSYWIVIDKEYYRATYLREQKNYYVFYLGEREVHLTKKHFGVWWEVVSV